jgi:hypothetical protein
MISDSKIADHCFVDRNNVDYLLKCIYEAGYGNYSCTYAYIYYDSHNKVNTLCFVGPNDRKEISKKYPLVKNAEAVFVVYEDEKFEFLTVNEFYEIPQERFP